MTGNNSCGARSIVYGTMRDNVRAVDAILIDGSEMIFGEVSDKAQLAHLLPQQSQLVSGLLDLGRREQAEVFVRVFLRVRLLVALMLDRPIQTVPVRRNVVERHAFPRKLLRHACGLER